MAGGYLNIVAIGNANIILTGNPSKTFFKVAYSKYTNFGLQKFRLDYEGSRDLRLTEESKFVFKVKKYAQLLMDTYVVINLPDIWSPIYNPSEETSGKWVGYDFRWIENIGIQMIKSIEINCGSTLIQKYSGAYLSAMVERDFTAEKKKLFNEMSGNIDTLNDPANAFGRENAYPSAFYTSKNGGSEPSIRGKTLYIPINTWFTLDSRCAFPLISLQYSELTISVTMRPIQELFQVRDIYDLDNQYPYIQPDFNQEHFRMYRFLQTPPAIRIDTQANSYQYLQQVWNADIHLLSTYCFLSDEETKKFASEDQLYLVKDIIQYKFYNVTGTQRLKLDNSSGMVSNWLFYLQRNDINMRNEWSNYSNWPYKSLPSNILLAPYILPKDDGNVYGVNNYIDHGPRTNPDSTENTTLFITGDYSHDNQKEILLTMGILFEGDYRENTLQSGIFNLVEKYVRTPGYAKEGIYCYNFCLSTNPLDYQPSGAMNLSKFKNIEFEISTYTPQVDPANVPFTIVCSTTGQPIAVTRKPGWQLFQYNYDMTIYEERYNILSFIGGNAGMMYAR
jgi:hypothetical protein